MKTPTEAADRAALEHASSCTAPEARCQRATIDSLFARGDNWEDIAQFAAFHCQISILHLPPWQPPPCNIGPTNMASGPRRAGPSARLSEPLHCFVSGCCDVGSRNGRPTQWRPVRPRRLSPNALESEARPCRFWAVAQIQPQRDTRGVALVGAPRIRDLRPTAPGPLHRSRQQDDPNSPPGYVFFLIHLQWSKARFSPGVVRIVTDGTTPAHVPDSLIATLRALEVDGLIEPPPPPPRFRRGDLVQIRRGPFADRVGLVIGLRPHERVASSLKMLGGSRQVELPEQTVERWPGPDRVRQQNGYQIPRWRGIVR